MKKKKILVGIKSSHEIANDAIKAWQRAERNLPIEEPVHRLYFEDLPALLKMLSPKRMELLQKLYSLGPMNIRKLALFLNRDYKNVYTEVKELKSFGLIKVTANKLFYVPWDSICVDFPLLAKAN